MTKLHIFTQHGATYTFKDLTSFNENESVLIFSFTSQKDGTEKFGTIYVKNIVGYTYEGSR